MRRFTFIHRGEGAPEELSVELDGSRCTLSRAGRIEHAELVRLFDGRVSLLFERGRQICGRILAHPGGEVEVVTGAASHRIALAEPLRDRLAHASDHGLGPDQDEEIRALMPGRVVEVNVAVGERLAAGALVLVLEAMKMQNEIRTQRGGTVLRVQAEAGQAVERGMLLAAVRADALETKMRDI
jgi:biotin carboxyl carrier protein